MTIKWAVDRNAHDGKGYQVYTDLADEAHKFETVQGARQFTHYQMEHDIHPEESTWRIRPYEMDSSNAHLQELYGKQPDPRTAKYKVVIQMYRGAWEVLECPDEVEVVFKDLNSIFDEDGNETEVL